MAVTLQPHDLGSGLAGDDGGCCFGRPAQRVIEQMAVAQGRLSLRVTQQLRR